MTFFSFFFFFLNQNEANHEGTRTLNLLIRSQTPYPLGHVVTACVAVRYSLLEGDGAIDSSQRGQSASQIQPGFSTACCPVPSQDLQCDGTEAPLH